MLAVPSAAYINKERARLNKLALSEQFVLDEWLRFKKLTVEEFYRKMIHGQE